MHNYRLYSFVNYYLSPIQHGIQTGHCAVDLIMKYARDNTGLNLNLCHAVNEWAIKDKTFVVLNGGNNAQLIQINDAMKKSQFAHCTFYEDDQSLSGIMTCCAVLLPREVYASTLFTHIDDNTRYYEGLSDSAYFYCGENSKDFDIVNYVRTGKLV